MMVWNASHRITRMRSAATMAAGVRTGGTLLAACALRKRARGQAARNRHHGARSRLQRRKQAMRGWSAAVSTLSAQSLRELEQRGLEAPVVEVDAQLVAVVREARARLPGEDVLFRRGVVVQPGAAARVGIARHGVLGQEVAAGEPLVAGVW